MKVSFRRDNFHLSFSPTLVQSQYPRSKEHCSSIAADNEINQANNVRRGSLFMYQTLEGKRCYERAEPGKLSLTVQEFTFQTPSIENVYLECEHVLALSRQ